jgi:RNA polymerase sigma-70 factor, ECF subfamily
MGFALPTITVEVYELYFPSIYQFIRLRIDDRQTAEDIASDVFMQFIDSVGTLRGPRRSLRGWLFRVARNRIARHYGRANRVSETAFDELMGSTQSDSEELELQFIRKLDSERARNALRMLSADQQEVLILRFSEALSLQETAEVMGKSESAIKSLQFRAVDTLRSLLASAR